MSKRKKILTIMGTRPEAIKMAPVIHELNRNSESFESVVAITAQHREMLDQVLDVFRITPDIDLDLMRPEQDLAGLTARVVEGVKEVIASIKPDLLLVQGDTTTTFASALAAFYSNVPVGHVEAGLRTFNKRHPFPEEVNRKLTATLADLHFAPTKLARQNLLDEGVSDNDIHVTGNTIIDSLSSILDVECELAEHLKIDRISEKNRLVLVTAHRRENWGSPMKNICQALKEVSKNHDDVDFIFSVHLNPEVQEVARTMLAGNANIHLIEPLGYLPFVHLMKKSDVILTDSGGIQEEAPTLGTPVLVMRKLTERPEGLKSGNVKVIGTDTASIVEQLTSSLKDKDGGALTEPNKPPSSLTPNPYGDGRAAERIVAILKRSLTE